MAATIAIRNQTMANRSLTLVRVGMLAGILTILSGNALAHDPGLSAVEVRVLQDRIVAEVSFAPQDLKQIEPLGESSLLTIEDDRGKLELLFFSLKAPDSSSVHYLLEFSHSNASALRISAPVLTALSRGHKQFCSVYDHENKLFAERMFSAEANALTIDLRASSADDKSIFRFVLLGIEHIVTGYDHLAFLLALLLAGGSLRHNAKIITSFTVAHSLTLALATLGLITIAPSIVEPVIAASVMFVGLENLFRRRLAARWLVTFAFGLVHGLGFASVVRELGIGGSLGLPLLSFNLGVELAQIAIAALVLPLIWKLERRPSFTLKHVPSLSLLITFAGLYWLFTRI
jgi:hydrogenase/urease accessory protein HupE